MDLKYSHKKQKAETSSSFLPIGDTPVHVFHNPHFVSEVRNFRHCDRVNNVTCQVLYPLGNDNTNVINIYEISNNKFEIKTYTIDYQCVYPYSLMNAFFKQKAKLCAWLHAERGLPDPNILILITRFSVRNLCRFLNKGKEQSNDTKKEFAQKTKTIVSISWNDDILIIYN